MSISEILIRYDKLPFTIWGRHMPFFYWSKLFLKTIYAWSSDSNSSCLFHLPRSSNSIRSRSPYSHFSAIFYWHLAEYLCTKKTAWFWVLSISDYFTNEKNSYFWAYELLSDNRWINTGYITINLVH